MLPHEHIIFPLDFPSSEKAKKYIELLKDRVGLFKVGLELFVSEGPKVLQTIAEITPTKVFLDLKFHDIPETVIAAQRAANVHGAEFITVHCEGSRLLKGVVNSAVNETKILAITVLTSLSKEDLKNIGIRKDLQDPLKLVLHRARMAKNANCAGVVCSGKEVKAIKEELGKDFIVVVPGIRPKWACIKNDDQSRITTPFDAIVEGADYVVVGRPIRTASNPEEAAKKIAEEIAEGLNKRGF
jgi:orotidine-5'-phosphate decarboxylase